TSDRAAPRSCRQMRAPGVMTRRTARASPIEIPPPVRLINVGQPPRPPKAGISAAMTGARRPALKARAVRPPTARPARGSGVLVIRRARGNRVLAGRPAHDNRGLAPPHAPLRNASSRRHSKAWAAGHKSVLKLTGVAPAVNPPRARRAPALRPLAAAA